MLKALQMHRRKDQHLGEVEAEMIHDDIVQISSSIEYIYFIVWNTFDWSFEKKDPPSRTRHSPIRIVSSLSRNLIDFSVNIIFFPEGA